MNEETKISDSTLKQEKEGLGAIIVRSVFALAVAVCAAFILLYTRSWQETDGWQLWALLPLALGCVGLSAAPFRFNKVVSIIVTVLSPVATFFAMESFTHDPWTMYPSPIVLNVIVFFAFYLLLVAITSSVRWGAILTNILAAVVGLGNYFVILCRNVPILPWDIKSIRTAESVADNYELSTTWRVCLVVLLILLIMAINYHNSLRLKKLPVRIGGVVLSLVIVFGMNGLTHNETFYDNFISASNLFTQKATYRDNGFVISFMMNLQYLNIKKPAGYDTAEVDSIMDEAYTTYTEEHADTYAQAGEVQPNIIVIMDESFTDLAYLAQFVTVDATGNEVDYMPFIHSLMEDENVTTGNLHVSVCGGNTANSEFELLTGMSMCFLPNGSVAYQQHISGALPSLATVLAEQGYVTTGMHPYNASGWNRDKVYPWLGFENTYFKDTFENPLILRKYISDASAFEKIIEVDESSSDPQFIFLVTMQNHGGYSDIYDNCPVEVYLRDIEGHEATNNYLTLVSKTDEALQELIEYYEYSDDPTMIVFFGDHQPSDFVANCILELTGKDEDDLTLTERESRYTVPFLIWKNYDNGVEAEKYDALSANYLSPLILEQANLKMSPYEMFLAELKDSYPVITANGYLEDGEMVPYKTSTAPEALKNYEKLQYNYLHNNQKNNEQNYTVDGQ